MSFHRLLEGLKWAAFIATLALLATQIRDYELPARFGLSRANTIAGPKVLTAEKFRAGEVRGV